MIIGVLMAGGKGRRLKTSTEKPLYKFNNKPLICNVIDNLLKSNIDIIIIALSPYTLKTKEYLIKQGINEFKSLNDKISYIVTPGEGYVKDYNYLLEMLESYSKSNTIFSINSDLPLVSSSIINNILCEYNNQDCSALSVFMPEEFFIKWDIDYGFVFEGLVPTGVNIVKSENIIQEQYDLVITDKPQLALNINTKHNHKIAIKFLKENKHLQI